MLLALIGFGIILIALGIYLYIRDDTSTHDLLTPGVTFNVIGVVLILFCTIIFFFNLNNYQQARLLPEQISMYQQENEKIETQIVAVVTTYMDYEQKTFEKLSIANMDTETIVALVSMFPELKSDPLVQAQIATMVANNNTIKTLRQQLITAKTLGWWLWFAPLSTSVE